MEGGSQELAARVGVPLFLLLLLSDHVGNGSTVHRIEVGVDLVKEVKGSRVATLNGEDDRERHDTLPNPR